MNKKKLILMTSLIVIAVQSFAQQIFLQHDGKVTRVYEGKELKKAVDAAVDGDKIYFTGGYFSSDNGSEAIAVNKNISFVGCGAAGNSSSSSYDYTTCSYSIKFCFPKNTTLTNILMNSIDFTGSITFDSDFNQDLANVKFRKCRFGNGSSFGNKTLLDLSFDRCDLASYNELPSNVQKLTMRNCDIDYLSGNIAAPESCNLINCNIASIYGESEEYEDAGAFRGNLTNCIVGGFYNYPYFAKAVSLTNVLFKGDASAINKCTPNKVYPYDGNETLINMSKEELLLHDEWKGTDGTVVGKYGGKNPYSLNSSLPGVSSTFVHWDIANKKIELGININQ